MKLEDIPFEDEAFKAAVFASGETEAEAVTAIKGRKQSIKSAAGIEYLPNLTWVDLTRNQLRRLDLSGNPKLAHIFVGNNQLEALDVSHLAELEELEIFMNDLVSLDLRDNPRLEVLYANANDLCRLDLSANTVLSDVQLNDNSLKSIVLPQASEIQQFFAENNLLPAEEKMALQQRLAGCDLKL